MTVPSRIVLPHGFKFAAATAGLKASGKPDLGLILAAPGTNAAAVFTKNQIVAAPVQVGRGALIQARGRTRAVIVNSGNANCATGESGIRECNKVCRDLAARLGINPAEVFPSSTGIIGVPLPAAKITAQLPTLIASAAPSGEGLLRFADAILTTDTRPKLTSARLKCGVTITGIAKGSGMIHPQLATMLVYLLTDVRARVAELRSALKRACDASFNVISVDGDTSTNDTVLLLASAAAEVRMKGISRDFDSALLQVCQSLAEQVVADGEGVQHLVRLRIEQARSRGEALQVARTISHSLLVKTAWAGADPNWGRILAAIGRSPVRVNPKRVTILIGNQTVCRAAAACRFDQRRAHEELGKRESTVTVRLGTGNVSLDFLTTDLTAEYVKINADYST
jgi:glutamate N-acetyltransferase/amino-acid N-acetyltransferase